MPTNFYHDYYAPGVGNGTQENFGNETLPDLGK